jgi:glycosyltransferase involved in cell wall biosynthesis
MAAVKFSVVIPTRERAATLRHALHTCLDQKFDDYEIVVSDNDGSPATKAVVDEAGSPKVKYVRTPGLLAMSSNWDFAVSHARGEYVILIGDDDGLLPHALVELDTLTRGKNAKVVRWEPAYYTWPSFALPGHSDYLRVPLGRGVRELAGLDVIRAVIAFQIPYTALPMLYNSAVHRSVLDELRKRTGRVFPHPVPDVYSGFAVAAVAGKFHSTDIPMTIAGQSGASNGIAVLFNRGQSAIDREFRELNAKEGLLPDPRIPDLPVFPTWTSTGGSSPRGASRIYACRTSPSGARGCGGCASRSRTIP